MELTGWLNFVNHFHFKICGPLHGLVDKSQGPLLFKCILPGVLMTDGQGSSSISSKGLGVIREHALHFIKHLMAHVSSS